MPTGYQCAVRHHYLHASVFRMTCHIHRQRTRQRMLSLISWMIKASIGLHLTDEVVHMEEEETRAFILYLISVRPEQCQI